MHQNMLNSIKGQNILKYSNPLTWVLVQECDIILKAITWNILIKSTPNQGL